MFRKKNGTKADENGEMSFLDHLEEMRGVILKSVIVLILTFIAVLTLFNYFNALMMHPLNSAKKLLATVYSTPIVKNDVPNRYGPVYVLPEKGKDSDMKGPYYIVLKDGGTLPGDDKANGTPDWIADVKLRSMSFTTPIMVYFYVGALGSVGVSLPFILYFAAGFIAPGLTQREKRLLRPGMFAGVILFCLGTAFAFFGILPMGIAFMTYLSNVLQLEMFPDAQSYYSLVIFVTAAIGITFELPLVMVVLIYLGIVKVDWLKKNRRLVIVLLLIFAAIVTPPDFITQVTLASLLYMMYEGALFIGGRMRLKKLEREAEEERRQEAEDEAERKEYAKMVAKERLAAQKEEEEHEREYDDPADYEVDRSHYGGEDDYMGDYGLEEYSDEDAQIDSYVDYGRLSRNVPDFSPNWDLNRKDTSFFAPDWTLNDKSLQSAAAAGGENTSGEKDSNLGPFIGQSSEEKVSEIEKPADNKA